MLNRLLAIYVVRFYVELYIFVIRKKLNEGSIASKVSNIVNIFFFIHEKLTYTGHGCVHFDT